MSRSHSFRRSIALTLGGLFLTCAASVSAQPSTGAPTGRLVDVGGRNLHINCTGHGKPTVMLEAGASAFSLDWMFVQAEVEKTNRVCSYDRAGYAWSDPGRIETAQNSADDLHRLLQAAEEPGPYVLVGASFGGVIVRWFQLQYPDEVAGLVFVDPSHEDELSLGVNGKATPIWAVTVEQVHAMIPSGDVPPQPVRPAQTGAPFNSLPPGALELRATFETELMQDRAAPTRDDVVAMMEAQVTAFATLHERRAAAPYPLGSLPVVVLTREKANATLKAAHADLAAQSSNSRHTVVPGAGHEIHLFRPDAVVTAIHDVVCGDTNSASVSERLDQIVQPYVADQTFMGSVLVAKGDHVLLSKGYGQANLEWNVPNTPSTKFRIGSLTKQFTAAAILLLEERGALRVEDPITKYLADAPAAWADVTIFHLLTHTSGIPNFTTAPDMATKLPFSAAPATIVGWFRDRPLDFEPGTAFRYSNSGYVLLGYLIERVTGVSYETFLRDNIFAPLQMTDSGYDSAATLIDRRASGYAPTAEGLANAAFLDMSLPYAAGGLYSTVEDLARWERALFDGALLSAASLHKMTTPFKEGYAMGVLVRTVDGREQFSHNGGINGFNASIAYYPESHVTVAVLGNLSGNAPDRILSSLSALAHEAPAK